VRAPAAIGVALGNVPLQDQLYEVLAMEPGLDVRACRTDAELEMLLAGRVLGGVVLGPRLVGLDQRVLPAVARTGVRAVLLVPPPAVDAQRARLADSVPNLSVLADTVSIAAVRAALQGSSVSREAGRTNPDDPPHRSSTVERVGSTTGAAAVKRGRVVVVTGCAGSGSTTVIGNVGYAAGVSRSVAVADMDLLRPSLVPMLDGDPSLGLAGIMRAEQSGVTLLAQALDEHLQPLGDERYSPHARLLGGLPLDGSSQVLTADLALRLLEALRPRLDLVLVDLGHVLSATERVGAVQRAMLLAAEGILVVSGCDRVSVKRTLDYVARLVDGEPHPDASRLALVLNRHDRRRMEAPEQIAGLVGLPLAACVPVDPGALDASGTGLPLVARGSGAARTLLQLAEALGSPAWPPQTEPTRSAWWRTAVSAASRLRRATAAARTQVVGDWTGSAASRSRPAGAHQSTESVQP
jgi:Flp pilus assembly CpaE family ATPase